MFLILYIRCSKVAASANRKADFLFNTGFPPLCNALYSVSDAACIVQARHPPATTTGRVSSKKTHSFLTKEVRLEYKKLILRYISCSVS